MASFDEQEFSSFADLGRHLKAKESANELDSAIKLDQSGRPLEAATILRKHNLASRPAAEKLQYARCYYNAAKVAISNNDIRRSLADIRSALNLGYEPWHVHRRMELVQHPESGERFLPASKWMELSRCTCSTCITKEPTALESAQCSGVLRPPFKPVYLDHTSDFHALGVYRWRGDPDSYNALSRMIRWMKKHEGREVCRYLALLMVQELKDNTEFLDVADMIVPVPLDPERAKERGFDNVAEIAMGIEHIACCPYGRSILEKPISTPHLRSLSWSERRATIAGAIKKGKKATHVRDATILLIDDVTTSGATLNTCAEQLLEAGASSVLAVALARAESTQASHRHGGPAPLL